MVGLGGATAATQPEAERPPFILGETLPTAGGFTPEAVARFEALRGPKVNVPDIVKKIVPNGGGLGANTDLARVIETIDGTAYAFPAAKGGVCVVTPERNIETREVIPGAWGVGCTSQVAARNEVTIKDVDEKGRGRALVLVADDARVWLTSGDGKKALESKAGVVSTEIAADDSISITTAK